MILLVLAACVFIPADEHAARTGEDGVVTDGGDGTDGADGTPDGADGADGASDGADGAADGTDGTAVSPWAGSYTGTIEMELTGGIVPGDCEGEISATISDAGLISGTWECEGIDGDIDGSISGSDAGGEIVLRGNMVADDTWSGFIVDSEGGLLTGEFAGLADSSALDNDRYDGSFRATR